MSFSKESLQHIKKELNAVPYGGISDFSMHLYEDEIRANYFWNEGFVIRCQDGHYICIHHMERSTKTYEISTEAEAVEKFISIARRQKQYSYKQ